MKSRTLFVLILLLIASGSLFADISNQVVVVYPNVIDHVVKNYNKVASWFENSGNSSLADDFRSYANERFGSGTLLETPGGKLVVITNYHVIAQANSATLVFAGRSGDGPELKVCPVIAIAPDLDLAIIEVIGDVPESATPLEFSSETAKDGMEVWSAGFPGLISAPSWQFASGNVTNQEASVEELDADGLNYVIQHSAPIDPGSSGGPLLVKGDDDKKFIVGINTWSVSGRDNTYFSVPAENVNSFLELYGDDLPDPFEQGAPRIDGASHTLLEALKNPEGDSLSLEYLEDIISDELVSTIGWKSFLGHRKSLGGEEQSKLIWDLLNSNPYHVMRRSITFQMVSILESREVSLISTNEESKIATTVLSLGEDEGIVEWKLGDYGWEIHSVSWLSEDPLVTSGNQEEEETEQGDSHFDRDFIGHSISIRVGMLLPFLQDVHPEVTTKGNVGLSVGFESSNYFSKFFGFAWGMNANFGKVSGSHSSGDDEFLYGQLLGEIKLIGQLPILLASGVTLNPYLYAGFNAGVDVPRLVDYSIVFLTGVPVGIGFEFALPRKESSNRRIIWGVDVSYNFPIMEESYRFEFPSGYDNVNIAPLKIIGSVRFHK